MSTISTLNKRDKFPLQPAPSIQEPPTIVVIGNSITFHGPKPTSGWIGHQGMAASSPEHDYAHLLVSSLGLDLRSAYIRNFYPFETNDNGAKKNMESISVVLSHHPSIIVLQLGDNVKFYRPYDLYLFRVNYRALLARAASSSAHVYCVSTFWRSRIVDWVIRSACDDFGSTFVDIGDIYNDPHNLDKMRQDFSDAGVEKHPKDYAMREIAARLESAIRQNNSKGRAAFPPNRQS